MDDRYEARKKALVSYYREHRTLPTYDELVTIFGVQSKGSLYKYIDRFIDDGLVGKSAGGKLIPTTKLYGLRVLGTVQAGFPTTAEEQDIGTMSLDDYLLDHPEASYMLTVTGDSMIDAGIVAGDMVVVDRRKTPKDGDIVVAEVDHEWTMKYLLHEHGKPLLRPANKNYPDIHPSDELNIAGVVTSVIRKYS
jgi:repressor LexA